MSKGYCLGTGWEDWRLGIANIRRTYGGYMADGRRTYGKHTTNMRQKWLRTYSEHTADLRHYDISVSQQT